MGNYRKELEKIVAKFRGAWMALTEMRHTKGIPEREDVYCVFEYCRRLAEAMMLKLDGEINQEKYRAEAIRVGAYLYEVDDEDEAESIVNGLELFVMQAVRVANKLERTANKTREAKYRSISAAMVQLGILLREMRKEVIKQEGGEE